MPKASKMLGKRKRSSKSSAMVKRRKSTYTSRSKQTSNPSSFLIHRGIGLPDKFRTKLLFCDSFALANFNTTITQYKAYNLSGIYDPDPAIGGGQPTWFDTFAAIYNSYQVAGAKMTVTFTKSDNTGVANDGPYMIGTIGSTQSSIASTDAPTLCTTANSQWDVLHQQANKNLAVTYSPKMISTVGYNQSGVGSNAVAYYGLIWASPQGTAVTGTVNCVVTIEYVVDFFNLKQVVDL